MAQRKKKLNKDREANTAMGLNVAIGFATAAHHGQKRKYTGEDYMTHPAQVARWCHELKMPYWAVVVAILHDVIEDTTLTYQDISEYFGPRVADGVAYLTNSTIPGRDGNRAERTEAYIRQVSCAGPEIQTIKLLDLLHNAPSIFKHDPKFGEVFAKECVNYATRLTKGNKDIRRRLKKVAETFLRSGIYVREYTYETREQADPNFHTRVYNITNLRSQ